MSKTEAIPIQAEMNIGMVGHVDHGKTTLTKLLTGVWTDTHSEELKKGISIRLGYADAVFRKCLKCSGTEAFTTSENCSVCEGKTKVLRKVSFVDAPGHETLMTTMLSGAALMQGAILVIAANEKCPQPRTVEHLMALEISGIKNLVVVQNKVDLVEREKALENFNQIKSFLESHGYKDVPIIPLAANFGTNVDLLIEVIEEKIKTPVFDLNKPLKMFVARSFDVNKPGIDPSKLKGGVVGGTIIQGKIKLNDKIELRPGINGKKIETVVQSLGTINGALKEGVPGGLIAIGSSLDMGLTRNDQMRGQIVGAVNSLPEPITKLSLELHVLKRLLTDSSEKIKFNESLVLTIGTATTIGVVVKEKSNVLELDLKTHVIAEKNQRVAISKKIGSAWRLYAYGIVK